MTSISGMLGWECMGKGRTRPVQIHPCSEKQRSDHTGWQLQWRGDNTEAPRNRGLWLVEQCAKVPDPRQAAQEGKARWLRALGHTSLTEVVMGVEHNVREWSGAPQKAR